MQNAKTTYSDGMVAKFLPNGTPVWLTYIGSNFEDELTGFDISPIDNNLYCIGNTNSSTAIIMHPKTGATNNSTFVGPDETTCGIGWEYDGFIFQLAQDGLTSPWRTYAITGNSIDVLNKCKFDATGNFFVVGVTNSSDAPVVASGSQYSHSWTNTSGSDPCMLMSDGYIMPSTR